MNSHYDYNDVKVLAEIGVPMHEMNGYSVMDGEEFILREFHSNRREQGYDVPEKYQPETAPRKERELKYQSKMMFDVEGERVNRVPEGFPDPYKDYDDEEMCICPDSKEWIPIWLRDKRIKQEEKNQEWLQYCREKHKRGMNISSAEKLQVIREKKMKKEGELRSSVLETALREREERLSKTN